VTSINPSIEIATSTVSPSNHGVPSGPLTYSNEKCIDKANKNRAQLGLDILAADDVEGVVGFDQTVEVDPGCCRVDVSPARVEKTMSATRAVVQKESHGFGGGPDRGATESPGRGFGVLGSVGTVEQGQRSPEGDHRSTSTLRL
jgi:hypothetical protein